MFGLAELIGNKTGTNVERPYVLRRETLCIAASCIYITNDNFQSTRQLSFSYHMDPPKKKLFNLYVYNMYKCIYISHICVYKYIFYIANMCIYIVCVYIVSVYIVDILLIN